MKENNSSEYPLLYSIQSPKDLKNINNLVELCSEIRRKLIEVVSKNGGHLAPNLGIVELTTAIYRVFNQPEDKIIWDVGHQCYVHKMFTGRLSEIETLRKENGLSGFTNRKESPYDIFTSGHSSTSISSALGLARSKKILGEKGNVVAVIGDGALTGGLAYEGLNNAQKLKNFTLILNDNTMSISKNVGAVARYLASARIRPTYVKAKNILEKILEKTKIGLKIENLMNKSKSVVKNFIYHSSIFEEMGFAYYGPVDGHNIAQLEKTLNAVKAIKKPKVVHVITSKGKGYEFAEKSPHIFHGVSPFEVETGKLKKSPNLTFSEVFGEKLCEIAKNNSKVCAVTAAMTSGTGLSSFKSRFKQRFFDVGIAEGHAVTYCAGLAAGGLVPVFAVYSSFLQRSYDQLVHDVSLQGLKVILAIDRAGFVGEDGEAHQGLFDVPFLNTIPEAKMFSPSFFEELQSMMENIISSGSNRLYAVRYPKGGELLKPDSFKYSGQDFDFYGNLNSEVLLVTYGRLFSEALECQERLKTFGLDICILKFNVIKPINLDAVKRALNYKYVVFFEESIKSGGVAEKFGFLLLEQGEFKGKYRVCAVNDVFVPHASVKVQLKKFQLNSSGMKEVILDIVYGNSIAKLEA